MIFCQSAKYFVIARRKHSNVFFQLISAITSNLYGFLDSMLTIWWAKKEDINQCDKFTVSITELG